MHIVRGRRARIARRCPESADSGRLWSPDWVLQVRQRALSASTPSSEEASRGMRTHIVFTGGKHTTAYLDNGGKHTTSGRPWDARGARREALKSG